MNQLVHKLELITAETVDKDKISQQKAEEKALDEFGLKKKKKIGNATRDIKKRIEERNLLFKKGNEVQQMGIDIRSEIHNIKKDTEELEQLYKEQKVKIEERKKKRKKKFLKT